MKFAILSDLHIFEGPSKTPPSYLDTQSIGLRSSTNPFNSLRDLIKSNAITADHLICPGDIADKASPAALQVGWQILHELRALLSAREVFVTNGNHDVDSRYQFTDFDAKGVLLALTPYFPRREINESNSYWARNYFIWEEGDLRVLLINSAAYHGMSGKLDKENKPVVPPEYLHGRVSKATVTAIQADLATRSEKAINIAVFHHHPSRHHGITYDDYSEMEGGSLLLAALTTAKRGPWMVIHGHKHIPRLGYADGGGATPVIFGAGSFSAQLLGEIAQTRNQFYLLEIENRMGAGGLSLCGQVSTWDWAPGTGWTPAAVAGGISAAAGFGYRGPTSTVAQQISDFMTQKRLLKLRRKGLLDPAFTAAVPTLPYVLPVDFEQLEEDLRKRKITVSREGSGTILEIVKDASNG